MSTSLLSLDVTRGYSRARLVFSAAMGAGAFTSTSYYSVMNLDGNGANPTSVVAVFAVASASPANSIVELAIEPALSPGALYAFTVTAAPDAGSNPVTGTLNGATGLPLANPPNAEPAATDYQLFLYGRDIVHDGNDFVEDATGDLATIVGRDNWLGAIFRRMTSGGVNWDPAYSPRADQFVNAPDVLRLPLAGRLVAQARADDRTKQATCTVAPFASDPTGNGWVFQMTIVGRDGLDPATINVPPNLAQNS